MKIQDLSYLLLIFIIFANNYSTATEKLVPSRITEVKLYQNQAKIIRNAKIILNKGTNHIEFSNLPPLLYNWSIKGSLPKKFHGKIITMEVVKKAMVQKRQKRILNIEQKLKNLQEQDQVYVDNLKNIKAQEKFLNSILEFTNQTVSKELATRIPQITVWDNTLEYVSKKKTALLTKKRLIEKRREDIGKKIQKWEFELSQIAGRTYFINYRSLNKAVLQNRSSLNIQQFVNITEGYGKRYKLLKKPAGRIDFEKRLILDIFSSAPGKAAFTFSYVVPNTYWKMMYDVRAASRQKSIKMIIYGNIYQKTGENWKDIALSMSTGAPIKSIIPPVLNPWYLDIRKQYSLQSHKRYRRGLGGANEKAIQYDKKLSGKIKQKEEEYRPVIKEKGPYFEIALPLKQSIASSAKYQKKYIREFTLKGKNRVNFFFEAIPGKARYAYRKVRLINSTRLPWLSGTAQIFLDNEFMGKATIPYTPPGQKEDFILGVEPGITAKKELVKKYEDTAGLFGGNRRIRYHYKLTVENQLSSTKKVIVYDTFPVSRNKKIKILIENLSSPFFMDKKFKESTQYSQGIKRWKVSIKPHKKITLSYELSVIFDKKLLIRGLK